MRILWILSALIAWPSFAHNHHEHLSNLPRPEDFMEGRNHVLKTKIYEAFFSVNTRPADQEAEGRRNLEIFIRSRAVDADGNPLPKSAVDEMVDRALKRYKPGIILSDVADVLGQGDRERGAKLMLAMPDPAKVTQSPAEARKDYIQVENLRKIVLAFVSPEIHSRIFSSYWRNESLANRSVLHVTVPPEYFFDDQGLKKLKALKELANRPEHRIEARFFYSVGRRSVLSSGEDFERSLSSIRRAMEKGLVHGIDVTGSMAEVTARDPAGISVAEVAGRLRKLFDLANQKGVSLRLHAFEGTDTGLFYDALKEVLKTYDKPVNLRIGHIHGISDTWVDLLAEFQERQQGLRPRKGKLLVEANVESNVRLQGATIEKILEIARKLQAKGVDVVSGSDGRGILGERSSYESQAHRLSLASGGTFSFHLGACDPQIVKLLRAGPL